MNKIKVKVNLGYLIAFALLSSLSSCVKKIDDYQPSNITTEVSDMNDLSVPSTFNYQVDKQVQISLKILANDNSPLKGIKLRLMDNSPEKNGQTFFTGITDQSGNLISTFKIPADVTKLVVNTNYIGVVNNALMDVSNR